MDKEHEILLLYINDFEWKDEDMKEAFEGHPKPGRVYRAAKLADEKGYRLKIEGDHTGGLEGLLVYNFTGDFPKWNCNMEVLTEDKLAAFDIESEDFIKIAQWKEENHEDLLKPEVEGPGGLGHIEDTAQNMMEQLLFPSHEESLADIKEADPVLYDTLKYILMVISTSHTGPNTRLDLELSTEQSDLARGANIGRAVDRIESYINAPHTFPPYLGQAIYYLSLELARLNTPDPEDGEEERG